ncbi:MAG TPA: methionyl-tRNA formyltransferase [Clostridia bacterium]
MNVIFMGTPQFAVLPLERLINSHHKVIAVVSQPDRPKGRGYKMVSPPVVEFARQHNISVYQFNNINKESQTLINLKPDIMVTAAYGQILSKDILNIAPYGIINIHASLLPKYRGPAPIQWAIIKGETKTGVTIMQTAQGLDTGDIILSKEIDIDPEDNAVTLTEKLSALGAEALIEALDLIEKGEAKFTPQDNDQASYYPMLKKETGKIDWTKSAEEIDRLVRGVYGWPGAYSSLWGEKYKIIKTRVNPKEFPLKPGTIANISDVITVMCGKNSLDILTIQAPGGKAMSVSDYLRGHKRYVGERFE